MSKKIHQYLLVDQIGLISQVAFCHIHSPLTKIKLICETKEIIRRIRGTVNKEIFVRKLLHNQNNTLEQ